jgi:small subunit ribosomal protein S16
LPGRIESSAFNGIDGRFIEKVGFFNPLLPKEKKERIGLEAERIKYWLGQGAQPTTR